MYCTELSRHHTFVTMFIHTKYVLVMIILHSSCDRHNVTEILLKMVLSNINIPSCNVFTVHAHLSILKVSGDFVHFSNKYVNIKWACASEITLIRYAQMKSPLSGPRKWNHPYQVRANEITLSRYAQMKSLLSGTRKWNHHYQVRANEITLIRYAQRQYIWQPNNFKSPWREKNRT